MVVWLGPVCLSLSTLPSHSPCFTRNVLSENCKRNFKQECIKRPQIYPSVNGNAVGLRVFVLSDLHTDYSENMAWVKRISTVKHKKDALLVAGDVAETFKKFIQTMSLLKDRFEHVFYVPGNHDLWCRWETDHQNDSIEKLNKLLGECKRIGVETNPIAIDGIGIIPLFSWYHESFDREEDISGVRIPSLEMACKDFHACKWPPELSSEGTSLAQYFDQMNNENQNAISKIQRKCSQVISFSHFIPRQELCPEKRMLFYPNLPKIIGSDFLETRIRSIHSVKGNASACHVFGHTHFCWDAILDGIRYYLSSESSIHSVKGNVSSCLVFGHTHFCWDAILDGVRYVQAPLAYPRERKRGMNGGEDWLPFCVYSDGQLAEPLSPCYWSDYYSENPRAPHITQLAPWVAKYYLHRKI